MPRMRHEKHGFHVAGQQDVAKLEAAGWSVCDDEQFAALLAAKLAPPPELVTIAPDGQVPESSAPAESEPALKPRRGRPPKGA